jgi:hypothetical protein
MRTLHVMLLAVAACLTGACAKHGGFGSHCTRNDGCESRICLGGSVTKCSRICSPTEPCPSGWTCDQALHLDEKDTNQDKSICQPAP